MCGDDSWCGCWHVLVTRELLGVRVNDVLVLGTSFVYVK